MADKDGFLVAFKQVTSTAGDIDATLDPTLLRMGTLARDDRALSDKDVFQVVADPTTGARVWRQVVDSGSGVLPGYAEFLTVQADTVVANGAAVVFDVAGNTSSTSIAQSDTSTIQVSATGTYEFVVQATVTGAGQLALFTKTPSGAYAQVAAATTGRTLAGSQVVLTAVLSLVTGSQIQVRNVSGASMTLTDHAGDDATDINATITVKQIG